MMLGISYGFVFFTSEAITALPRVVETAIPAAVEAANKYEIEIPFEDVDSLKVLAVDTVKAQLANVAKIC